MSSRGSQPAVSLYLKEAHTTGLQLAFLLANFDIVQDFIELDFGNKRSVERLGILSHSNLLDYFDELFHKGILSGTEGPSSTT